MFEPVLNMLLSASGQHLVSVSGDENFECFLLQCDIEYDSVVLTSILTKNDCSVLKKHANENFFSLFGIFP